MISASQALARLREGNKRFAAGRSKQLALSPDRRQELLAGQKPFAIILGCSDSRVPAEIIFDQGLGDLFVIRVAGNVVVPALTGSIEFAAEKLGTRLIVVLGHTHCGAVQVAIEELQRGPEKQSPNISALVDCIRPSLEPLLQSDFVHDPEVLWSQAVRANIRDSANQLRHTSPILERFVQEEGLLITGAEYDLETGLVDFFDYPI